MGQRRSILLVATLVATGCVAIGGASSASAVAGPTVRVGDVQVSEGDTGSVVVKVPVDLSGPSAVPVSMHYRIAAADSTADAGDALFKTGTLGFAAGTTSKSIPVTVTGDASVEPDQHIAVTVTAPTNGATLSDGTGSVDIVDDDSGAANPATDVSIGSTSVEEANAGKHTAYVPITLSRPATTTVKVQYAIACSTASLITDVSTPKLGSVTFQAGQRVKLVGTVIDADTRPEANKAVIRDITSATGATVVGDPSNVTIVDDDNATPPVNDGELTDCGHGLAGFQKESVPTDSYSSGAVGSVQQLSVANDGSAPHYAPDAQGAAPESGWASASQDGSAVVFQSRADNLVPGDTNGKGDIFVRDRRAGTTERVSLKSDGSQITAADMGGDAAWPDVSVGAHPAISADGRYVVFQTPAALVPADTNTNEPGLGDLDIYVYDRQAHAVDLVSADGTGQGAGGAIWFQPSISAHGRYVTFTVEADQSSLFPNARDTDLYVFVRDRLQGTTTQLLDHPSFGDTVISADGGTVVTQDVVDSDHPKLVAVDLATGITDRVDVRSDGVEGDESSADLRLFGPSISSDGRYVGFASDATTLSGVAATPGVGSGYIRDRIGSTTVPVGLAQAFSWPVSIDDGAQRFVAGGSSMMMNLVTATASFIGGSSPGRAESSRALSGDGHWVVFRRTTAASDEVFTQRLG